jgi:hypothetical protein
LLAGVVIRSHVPAFTPQFFIRLTQREIAYLQVHDLLPQIHDRYVLYIQLVIRLIQFPARLA